MTANPDEESTYALDEAKKRLDEASSMRTAATRVAHLLKMQREHNHFGEMIRDSMNPRGHKDA